MKIRELIAERISTSPEDITKIVNVMTTWSQQVRRRGFMGATSENHQQDISELSQMLAPVINEIVKLYSTVPISVNVEVFPVIPQEDPSVAATVDPQWQENNNTWHNNLKIRLTLRDYQNLVRMDSFTKPFIRGMTSVISHEVIHLIQTLKRIKKSAASRLYAKPRENHPFYDREVYLSSADEIDAWAQSFATDVIQQNRQEQAMKFLRQGGEYSGKFPWNDFDDYLEQNPAMANYLAIKQMAKTFKNMKNNNIRIKIWRRFLKKAWEKIQDSLTS